MRSYMLPRRFTARYAPGSTQASGLSQSVAESLRQATQLLLQAAERLKQTPSPSQDAQRADSATVTASGTVSRPRSALRECVYSLRRDRHSSSPSLSRTDSTTSGCNTMSLFQPLQSSRHRYSSKKYRPYSEKKWQHVFVCLAQVGQFIPLDTADRVRLVQAGLGEKRISCALEAGAEELHQELLVAFPRLRNGGGYEFLKLDEANRKSLTVVPPPTGGYIPVYLKAIFMEAKMFLRPLQKCLDLTPIENKVYVAVNLYCIARIMSSVE